MRLYFKPGACSLSSRIVLTELGLPYEAVQVDTETGQTEAGADYHAINPKGYVPALELDAGVVITENPAILQYLADSNVGAGLAPSSGTVGRAHLQEWLNFTSSELHKAFSPWFSGRALDGVGKERAETTLARRIGDVEHGLGDGRSYILGSAFSVADAYLFVVLNWANFIGVDLARWPSVSAYFGRVAARPAVRAAMIREGLIKDEARCMTTDVHDISQVLSDYFDALHFCDVEKLKRVFHPKAIYATADETPLLYRTMDEYVAVVAMRQSPASKGETRRDHIDAVDLAGENTAHARVRCSIGTRDFVDFLTLVRTEGQWRILSKIFQIIERQS